MNQPGVQTPILCDAFFAQLCQTYLTFYQYDAALFFAERAFYENPVEENLQLVSECYIRQGKFKQAFILLQNARSASNRYLYALCCIQLEKYTEAESSLLPGQFVPQPDEPIPDEILPNIAGGEGGLVLLAVVCRHQHRYDAAIAYYKKCLEIAPFSWAAMTGLAELGVEVPILSMFTTVTKGEGGGEKPLFATLEEAVAAANGDDAPPSHTSHPLSGGDASSSGSKTQRQLAHHRRVEGGSADCSPAVAVAVGMGFNGTGRTDLGAGGTMGTTMTSTLGGISGGTVQFGAQGQTPGGSDGGGGANMTPRLALSLGLSSLSLRAPIASPIAAGGLGMGLGMGMGMGLTGAGGTANGGTGGLAGLGRTLSGGSAAAGVGAGAQQQWQHRPAVTSNLSDAMFISRRHRSRSDCSSNSSSSGSGHGVEARARSNTVEDDYSGFAADAHSNAAALSGSVNTAATGEQSDAFDATFMMATGLMSTSTSTAASTNGSMAVGGSGGRVGGGRNLNGTILYPSSAGGSSAGGRSGAGGSDSSSISAVGANRTLAFGTPGLTPIQHARDGGDDDRDPDGEGEGAHGRGRGAPPPSAHGNFDSLVLNNALTNTTAIPPASGQGIDATSLGASMGFGGGGGSGSEVKGGGGTAEKTDLTPSAAHQQQQNRRPRVSFGPTTARLSFGSSGGGGGGGSGASAIGDDSADRALSGAGGGLSGLVGDADGDDLAYIVQPSKFQRATGGSGCVCGADCPASAGGAAAGSTDRVCAHHQHHNHLSSSDSDDGGTEMKQPTAGYTHHSEYYDRNSSSNSLSPELRKHHQHHSAVAGTPGTPTSSTNQQQQYSAAGASGSDGTTPGTMSADRSVAGRRTVHLSPMFRRRLHSHSASAASGGALSGTATDLGSGHGVADSFDVNTSSGSPSSPPAPVASNRYNTRSSSNGGSGSGSGMVHVTNPIMVSATATAAVAGTTPPRHGAGVAGNGVAAAVHAPGTDENMRNPPAVDGSGRKQGGGKRSGGGDNAGKQSQAQAQQQQKQRQQFTAMQRLHQQQQRKGIALYIMFATATSRSKRYDCNGCVDLLHKLPRKHFSSGYTQYLVGCAYYEMNEYKSCVVALKGMVQSESHRVVGLEVLSTALWHLKRDRELCCLAQQVVEIDKFAPETWCVVGNCFSLQHEPETAIKFFERALQCCPSYTYAYTLCGHEYVSNEDLEKAIVAFRSALRCDPRHYNAWYGLGAIYYRQERLDLAEYHFRKAVSINGISSILKCYMGMVLHSQNNMAAVEAANAGDDEEALEAIVGYSIDKEQESYEILREASLADPKNPQLHFQLVHVLFSLDNYMTNLNAENDEEYEEFVVTNPKDATQVSTYLSLHPYLQQAIHELHILEELVPKEPPIFNLLGQIYHQKLRNIPLAMKYYNIAIELDPKESVTLKDVLNNLDEGFADAGDGEDNGGHEGMGEDEEYEYADALEYEESDQ